MLTQTLVPVIATCAMLTQPLEIQLMLGQTSALLIMAMCHMLTQTMSLLLDHQEAT